MTSGRELPEGLIRPSLAEVRPYVPGRPGGSGAGAPVGLASNEGPFDPMPGAQRIVRDSAHEHRRYPDAGSWALRDALAARLGLDVEQILPGAGIDGLITSLAALTLDAGDELAMCWPSFISWRQRCLVQGAVFRGASLTAAGAYDLDALAALVGPRTKLVVVVSPNNPTGAPVGAGDLRRFLDELPAHVLPVLDEAYFEYLPSGSHDGAALVAEGRPVAVLRTFSKAFGLAGLRVGYLMGPANLVAALGRVRGAFDVSAPAQAAAVASLSEADAELPERVGLIERERDRLAAFLEGLGAPPLPSAGNFLYVALGSEARAAAVNRELVEAGVMVRPTGPFGAPEGLRMTIGWPEENDRLMAALPDALSSA